MRSESPCLPPATGVILISHKSDVSNAATKLLCPCDNSNTSMVKWSASSLTSQITVLPDLASYCIPNPVGWDMNTASLRRPDICINNCHIDSIAGFGNNNNVIVCVVKRVPGVSSFSYCNTSCTGVVFIYFTMLRS